MDMKKQGNQFLNYCTGEERFKRVNYFVDDLLWGEVSETIVDNIEKIAVS